MPQRRRAASKKTPAIIEDTPSPERLSSTTPPASVQASSRKRKAVGSKINDSSPTTSPVQAPTKKARVVGQPTHGSVPSRAAAAKRLSFGSVDMEESKSEPPSPSKKSKISSTKEKPLFSEVVKRVTPLASPVSMEDNRKKQPKQGTQSSDDGSLPMLAPAEDDSSFEDAMKHILKRKTKKSKKAQKVSQDVIELSSGSESDTKKKAPVTPMFKPKSSLVRVKTEPLPPSNLLDLEAHEVSSGEDSEGSLKDFIVPDSDDDGHPKLEDDSDAGLSEHERRKVKGKQRKPVESESNDNGVGAVANERNALRLEWQDPILDSVYRRMPKFIEYTEMVCQRRDNSSDTDKLFPSKITRCMAQRNAVSVLPSINFESHLCFFNPARIDPSLVALDKSLRMIVPGTDQTAVLLTAGVASACYLTKGHNTGLGDQMNIKKEIGVMPYNQEFQLMTSNLVRILKVERLCSPFMGNTLWFSTKKEGAKTDNAWSGGMSVNVTPATADFFVSPRKTKPAAVRKNLSSLKAHQYPRELGFHENVPIYDARGFDFTPKSIENIKQLPLYKGGKADLDPWSAVTVGYAGGMYLMRQGIQSGNNTFAAHILFVLFHGVVDAKGLVE